MNDQKKTLKINDVGSLLLRLTLCIVILPHGCQLMLGTFGGSGFNAAMDYFINVEGLPAIIGYMVIFFQFFGSLFILFGFATRLVSIGMLIMFVGMILKSHLEYGFFMNWFGNQKGEGYEYHLLVIGMFASLITTGAGKLSLDTTLFRNNRLLNAVK
jgi:putative oxidoreductase